MGLFSKWACFRDCICKLKRSASFQDVCSKHCISMKTMNRLLHKFFNHETCFYVKQYSRKTRNATFTILKISPCMPPFSRLPSQTQEGVGWGAHSDKDFFLRLSPLGSFSSFYSSKFNICCKYLVHPGCRTTKVFYETSHIEQLVSEVLPYM